MMKNPERFFQGRLAWVTGAVFWTAIGLLSFAYQYLDVFTRGGTEPFHEKLIEELTGAWGVGLLFPVVAYATRYMRARRWSWPSRVTLHLLLLPAFSLLHTTWNWGTREAFFAVLGLGNYDYGIMSIRYAMEFPNDVIGYLLIVTFVTLFDHYRAAKDHETRMARLEAELNAARLQALESQLQPHFLFNALNTISSVMYRDVRAADTMITRLGDLLRKTLKAPEDHEVTLQEELETLQLYLDIMRTRFEETLTVELDVEENLGDARVPYLVLQPLVENALHHGQPGPGRTARVRVAARRERDRLELTVEDNGPGLQFTPEPNGNGVGLSNTRNRLERLHANNHVFALETNQTGGVTARISIPYHV